MSQSNVSAPRGNLQRDVQARPRLATLTCPNCLGTLQIQADRSAEAPCPICRHPLKYVAPPAAEPKPFVAGQRIPANPAPQPHPQPTARTRQAPRQAAAPVPQVPVQQTPVPQPSVPQTPVPQTPVQQAPVQPTQVTPVPQSTTRPAPPPARAQAERPAPASPASEHPLRDRLKRIDDFFNTPAGSSAAWVILAGLLTACVILFFHWDQERRERTLRMEAIESTRPPASHRPSTSSVPLLPGEPAPVDTFKIEE